MTKLGNPLKIYDTLCGIQRGSEEDTFGWIVKVC